LWCAGASMTSKLSNKGLERRISKWGTQWS
jgi:hypothetical protein